MAWAEKHLVGLSEDQRGKFEAYGEMLRGFNRRINLVSRESEEEILDIHIPHALALMLRNFPVGASIVDWGTGGGLPAIPLAIAAPHVVVHAVDVIEKKILAVRTMARRLGLANLEAWSGDAARWSGSAAYSVSRATAPLAVLWRWHVRVASAADAGPGEWEPGLICLKGGDLSEEIDELHQSDHAEHPESKDRLRVDVVPLREHYESAYFDTKVIVHAYRD